LTVCTEPGFARRIARYYDRTQVLYARLWSRRSTHYGFWGADTRSHRQAVRNLDRFVAERIALPSAGRVLDAGCGVGGTALHLAERYAHTVVGITLSREQARRARRLVARSPVAPRIRLCRGDFLASAFPDASFDAIVAIESSCYAEPKQAFVREAHRLLRPGGRLVVSDGFLARPLREDERSPYERFLAGFALQGLATLDGFRAELAASGFTDVRCEDCQRAILPSARRILRLSRIGVAACWLPSRIGLFPREWLAHGGSGLSQYRLFRDGAFRYAVFSATRPGME
jgi:cyclopropane fatty-acyl-phospholipid synthase-like methyltransferase